MHVTSGHATSGHAISGPHAANGETDAAGQEPALLAHLDRLVEELHVQAPKALNDFDEEGIHRARVATRRLSAALDLTKPAVGKKRRKAFGKVLRSLRRRLGPLRDADVMLGHLVELRGQSKVAGAVEWLSAGLVQERKTLRDASAQKGPASQVLADLGAWYPVRESIAAAGETLPTLLAQSLHLQLDTFIEHAGRIVNPSPTSQPPNPHELRIAGKALRYTLEMAVAQGHDLPGSVVKTFKRMQEALGSWHDFVVLTDKAMHLSIDRLLSHHDAAMQDKVLDLARVTLRRSARDLEGFGKLWNTKGEPLAASIRAAFPLAAPPDVAAPPQAVSESQTDRDQGDSAAQAVPAASPPDAPSVAS
jgi:CHAD domain-containing protein